MFVFFDFSASLAYLVFLLFQGALESGRAIPLSAQLWFLRFVYLSIKRGLPYCFELGLLLDFDSAEDALYFLVSLCIGFLWSWGLGGLCSSLVWVHVLALMFFLCLSF